MIQFHTTMSKKWVIAIVVIVAILLLGAVASMYGSFTKGTIYVPDSVNYDDFLQQISATATPMQAAPTGLPDLGANTPTRPGAGIERIYTLGR